MIIALYAALVAVMLLFDFVIRRMTLLYERRLRKLVVKSTKNGTR